MSQTTLTAKPKIITSKKRPKPDTEDEDSDLARDSLHDDSVLSTTPPSAKKQKKAPAPKKIAMSALKEVENEAMGYDGGTEPKGKKSTGKASDQYQKVRRKTVVLLELSCTDPNSQLTQLEHIIKRPDTYIGSVERTEKQMWVYNTESDSMEFKEVSFVPGLYKIFDEILVNAADNKQRDKNMDTMKVTVDREKGEISVYNNGRGIPIEIHDVRF
jgi:DNA topoisomerase-2